MHGLARMGGPTGLLYICFMYRIHMETRALFCCLQVDRNPPPGGFPPACGPLAWVDGRFLPLEITDAWILFYMTLNDVLLARTQP